MRIVLDASVVIDNFRTGRSTFGDNEELVMSSVTVAELYTGQSAQKEGRQGELLENFLFGVDILFPDLEMAKLVGKLKYKYKMSLGDAFVAALAIDQKLPLATLDKKAFGKIPGLKFYK